MPTASP
jgi:hypothetical protein